MLILPSLSFPVACGCVLGVRVCQEVGSGPELMTKLSWPLPFASEPSLYVHSRWERFCKAGGDVWVD